MNFNILLLVKCSYTRIGLKELLVQHFMDRPLRVVSGVKELLDYDSDVPFDIVITESGRFPSEISNALMLPSIVKCQSILLTGTITGVEVKFYQKAGFDVLVDNRSSKSDLLKIISQCLFFKVKTSKKYKQYTKRERDVLFLLLQGKSMVYISHDLNVSYKMVSHYKRSALHRIGAKSIVDIARGGEVIRLRDNLYQFQSHPLP